MSLLCARLSCGDNAAASLLFDAPGSRVLIIDLAESFAGIPLCAEHARTRTAPMGWTMVDERTYPARRAPRSRAPEVIDKASAEGKTRLRTVLAKPSLVIADLVAEAPVKRPTLRRPLEPRMPEPEPIAKRRAAKKAAAKGLSGQAANSFQTEIPGLETQTLRAAEPASEPASPEPVVELAIVESLLEPATDTEPPQPITEAVSEAAIEPGSTQAERGFPWERRAGTEIGSSPSPEGTTANGSLLTELIPSTGVEPASAVARSRQSQIAAARPTSRLLSRAFRVRD